MYTDNLPGVAQATDTLLHKGIPAVHFLGMRVHPPVASMVPAILKLRRLIREQAYDIVETSMVSPTVLASWAVRGMRARLVAGLHDVFSKDRYDGMKHRVWRYSVRRNLRTRFYAISEYAKRHWLEYSRTPLEHTRTIYNGIPNDCFEAVAQPEIVRKELGLSSGTRIVLFVGRMLMRKGVDTILDAVGPILHAENLHLLYIGSWDQPPEGFFPGEARLLERMKARIVAQGWSGRVRFLGRRNDVPRLMASSELLVHPARIEGFGLVLAEAMAAGLPVVASNVEGIPEVLAGTASLMVRPDDPSALREAVLKTLNRTPDEAARAIEKGRRRAEDFRISKRMDAMIDLFEEVLQRRF
jgi:glycosyltransferase involved in cell wall biosynthesis